MSDTTEDQKTKITLGFLTSWTLGLLFLLTAFVTISQSDTIGMGLACLFIAALLLPPARQFVHQKTGRSLSTGVRVVLFFVLLFGGAASISETNLQTSSVEVVQKATAQKKAPVKGLIVQEFTLERGAYGSGKIVGTLKNTTGRAYKYVQIEFGLYDGAGNTVGSTLANINNRDPDGTWRFEAPVFQAGATEAQVKDITSF